MENVLSLSSHILTTLETNLLSKGLSFDQPLNIMKAHIVEENRDFTTENGETKYAKVKVNYYN